MGLSINKKLNTIMVVTFLSIFTLFIANKMANSTLTALNNSIHVLSEIKVLSLELRKHEKDFIIRKKEKYKDKFFKKIKKLYKDLDLLRRELKKEGLHFRDLKKLNKGFKSYTDSFINFVRINKDIGLTPNNGAFKTLTMFNPKTILDFQLKDLANSFFSTKDLKYVEEFKTLYSNYEKSIQAKNKRRRRKLTISTNLQDYTKNFFHIVELFKKRGLNEKLGLEGEMRNKVHAAYKLSKKLSSEIDSIIVQKNNNIAHRSLIILIFLSSIIIGSMFFIFMDIKKSITALLNITNTFTSKDKDLKKRVNIKSVDEMGKIAKNINYFISDIQHSMDRGKTVSKNNIISSKEMRTTSIQIKDRASKQQDMVIQATELIGGFELMVRQSNIELVEILSIIRDSNSELKITTKETRELNESIDNSSKATNDLSSELNDLIEKNREIKNILEGLSRIADETNLLALNTSIEASRAGEYGKGFVVIADEVQKLSNSTEESLKMAEKNINSLDRSIMNIINKINIISNDMSNLIEHGNNSVKNIEHTSTRLGTIYSSLDGFVSTNNKLNELTNTIVTEMLAVKNASFDNVESANQILETSKILNQSSVKLDTELNQFAT